MERAGNHDQHHSTAAGAAEKEKQRKMESRQSKTVTNMLDIGICGNGCVPRLAFRRGRVTRGFLHS